MNRDTIPYNVRMIEQKEAIEVKSLAQPYLVKRGVDYFEYQLPVSVKAVISLNGQIPLLRNERNEWELPGGKLDLGESPTACVQREVHEELNIDIISWDECSQLGVHNFSVSPRFCGYIFCESGRERNAAL